MLNTIKNTTCSQLHIEQSWNYTFLLQNFSLETKKQKKAKLQTVQTKIGCRPILEYWDVVWYNCAQYEKEELEKIQHEIARIATGTTRLVFLNLYSTRR